MSEEQQQHDHEMERIGNNKGIKFSIKTGNQTWECTLQDRSTFEKNGAIQRKASSDTVDTKSSDSSSASSEKAETSQIAGVAEQKPQEGATAEEAKQPIAELE